MAPKDDLLSAARHYERACADLEPADRKASAVAPALVLSQSSAAVALLETIMALDVPDDFCPPSIAFGARSK